MFLYFNGDSFVAGAELGDYILPNYPGLGFYKFPYNVDRKSKHWKWHEQVHDIRLERKHELEKLERDLCFAGLVSKKVRLSFLNRALGGSSMDRIARTTVSDLIQIKKSNPDKKIFAFVGITNPQRFEVGIHDPVYDEYWQSVNLLNIFLSKSRQEEIDPVIKYKLTCETNYHGLVNFYKNIIFVNDFCKTNNITLTWIGTNVSIEHLNYWQRDFLDYSDLTTLKEYANLKLTIDMYKIALSLSDRPVLCPGGHFGQPVHDFAAGQIIKIINGMDVTFSESSV